MILFVIYSILLSYIRYFLSYVCYCANIFHVLFVYFLTFFSNYKHLNPVLINQEIVYCITYKQKKARNTTYRCISEVLFLLYMHLFPRFGNHTCFGLFLLHMSFLSMSVHLFSGFCYKAFITFFIDSVNHRTISCCYNVTVYHYMCIILPYKNSKRDKL
mgnify:CR=1 FL=1